MTKYIICELCGRKTVIEHPEKLFLKDSLQLFCVHCQAIKDMTKENTFHRRDAYCPTCHGMTIHAVDGDALEFENRKILVCTKCGDHEIYYD